MAKNRDKNKVDNASQEVLDFIGSRLKSKLNIGSAIGLVQSSLNNEPLNLSDLIGLIPSGFTQLLSLTALQAEAEKENIKNFQSNSNKGKKVTTNFTESNTRDIESTYVSNKNIKMRNSKGRKYGLGTGIEGTVIENFKVSGPGDTIVGKKVPTLTPAQQAYLALREAQKVKNKARLAPINATRQQWVDSNPGTTMDDYWNWQKQRNKGDDAGLSGMKGIGAADNKGSCAPGVNEKKAAASNGKVDYALGTGVDGTGDPIIDPLTGKPITSGADETAGFNTKQIVRYQSGVTSGETGKSGFYLYSKNAGEPGFDPQKHREFINQSEMHVVQRSPQWKEYMETQKFANGTGTSGVTSKNYMQTPSEALAENDIMMAKAEADAADNPWAMGVEIAGQIGSAIAKNQSPSDFTKLTSSDIKGSGEGTFLNNPNFKVMSPAQSQMFQQGYAAMGMNNAEGQIEAEGGEVVETPGGEPAELKGPKHASGGIDMEVPEGTKIYSDQLKGADGKTMADRKKAREKKELKLDELLITNKGDKAIANSHQRMRAALDMEEQNDLQMQEMATQFTQMQEFAMGTGNQGVKYEYGTDDEGTGLDFTTGDITGLVGNAVSMFAPMNNTLKNRASDTVNKNMYDDYGNDALATNTQAQNLLAGQHDNDLQRVTRASNGAKRQSRNSSRGVNTMRATDLAIDVNSNDANANLSDQYAKQMMAVLGHKSSLEASIGQVKAAGATAADLANRQDKDAFYTQLGKDKATIGQGLQQTGKDLNQLAQNETMMNMVNQMSKYFKFDKNNKIIAVNKQTKK